MDMKGGDVISKIHFQGHYAIRLPRVSFYINPLSLDFHPLEIQQYINHELVISSLPVDPTSYTGKLGFFANGKPVLKDKSIND
jgi:hypothetical protein